MLGQRVALEDVEKLMQHRDFIIETKIDGERMQLHKNDQEYRFEFSFLLLTGFDRALVKLHYAEMHPSHWKHFLEFKNLWLS